MDKIIIDPESRATMAREYFEKGYNCSQAVLLAYSDLCGIDEERAAQVASSFGGGMGRMREVCGSLSGAFMALGLICGYSDPQDREGKNRQYACVREIARRFAEQNGSIVCRELLAGVEHTDGGDAEARTTEYYKKRPCGELCACAARILADVVNNY